MAPDADVLLAGPAPVEQVGQREEDRGGLHPARLAIDRIPGVRVAHVPGGRHQQREVAARRAAGDPDPARVDAVVPGVVADEADRPIDVILDLGHLVAGLATRHDGEDGVAAAQQGPEGLRPDHLCDEK